MTPHHHQRASTSDLTSADIYRNFTTGKMERSPPVQSNAFLKYPPKCKYRIENGVPVFFPTMAQFKDFAKFIRDIEPYGMETGIAKVVPPKEWVDKLPKLDEHVKSIKIKNPIMQNISGRGGLFRLQNIEKQKTYDISQWKSVCEDKDHQPPSKRGAARRGRDSGDNAKVKSEEPDISRPNHWHSNAISDSFDYRFDDSEFEADRCEELEKAYWRSLTYNQPMYGADMPGSLFDDSVKYWNVPKLDNILNQLNVRIPGVNTAYLYCGMWKSTFAWHLEDMDLFSINYIHFGAPKQWYSISQKDHLKFYQLMGEMWPEEHKNCKEFLRHKTFHASPHLLQSMGIQVNKVVHYQQEFMLTFPFGYHSGFNYGYNVAESVNFANESWIQYGKKSKKCLCIDDSVGIDVSQLERHLKGEYTDDEGDPLESLPTPPSEPVKEVKSTKVKRKAETQISKSKTSSRPKPNAVISPTRCSICEQNFAIPMVDISLPRGESVYAHQSCARYISIKTGRSQDISKKIVNKISTSKCFFCNSKPGSKIECCMSSCKRSYHPTCALHSGALLAPSGKSDYNLFCRFHRPKRLPVAALEADSLTRQWAFSALPGDVVQYQYESTEIFAGMVMENNLSEETIILKPLNSPLERIEVAWKWIRNPGYDHINAFLYNVSTNTVANAAKIGRGVTINGEKIIFSDIPDINLVKDVQTGDKYSWITESLMTMEEDRMSGYNALVYLSYDRHRSTDTLANYFRL